MHHQAGNRFRLKTPTIAVAPDESGARVAVIVPADAIVELIDGIPEGTSLVLVKWGGRICEMFSQDIRERGEYTTVAPVSSDAKNGRSQSTHG